MAACTRATLDFNPLPSHEGRLETAHLAELRVKFQSTPLTRGETCACRFGDLETDYFNPLPSHEGRLAADFEGLESIKFQSTPLTRGETCACRFGDLETDYFNPLPSHEGRLESIADFISCTYFNPLPSHEGRQHKPPKIHPNLRQLTQQNHDTPLFGALQAPICGAEPDIRGAKPQENHDSFTFAQPSVERGITP